MLNQKLDQFITLIMDPESIKNTDTYVASRKITSNDLVVLLQYCNGAAYICGVAFDQLIKIRYNYFEMKDGFYITVNGINSDIPLTSMNLREFLSTGKFIEGTKFTGCPNTQIRKFARRDACAGALAGFKGRPIIPQ